MEILKSCVDYLRIMENALEIKLMSKTASESINGGYIRPGIEYILHGMNIIPQVTNLCLGLAQMMKRPLVRL